MATAYRRIVFDTPGGDAAYPALTTNKGFTNVRRWVPAFPDAATGTYTGSVIVPANFSSTAKVLCLFAANATANAYNVRVSTSSQADAESADAALTAEAFQSITTPGTANLIKTVTFPASGALTPTVAAGDLLTVKLERDGAGASGTDSLTVDLLLMVAYLSYTTT